MRLYGRCAVGVQDSLFQSLDLGLIPVPQGQHFLCQTVDYLFVVMGVTVLRSHYRSRNVVLQLGGKRLCCLVQDIRIAVRVAVGDCSLQSRQDHTGILNDFTALAIKNGQMPVRGCRGASHRTVNVGLHNIPVRIGIRFAGTDQGVADLAVLSCVGTCNANLKRPANLIVCQISKRLSACLIQGGGNHTALTDYTHKPHCVCRGRDQSVYVFFRISGLFVCVCDRDRRQYR